MRMIIKIDMDSAAFDDSQGEEVARILHRLAEDITSNFIMPIYDTHLRDSKGFRCGSLKVVKETT